MSKHKFHFDEIGEWSEIKLDIIREYAKAYSTIMARQSRMSHYYIDGFAGAGVHVSKSTGDWIPGSPLNALNIQPPFKHHFLIDLDGTKIDRLKLAAGKRADVTVLEGDCNEVLLREVPPGSATRTTDEPCASSIHMAWICAGKSWRWPEH